MYQALYRKWRPMKFEDVVGQEHITTTLKNQIINGKTAHYIFLQAQEAQEKPPAPEFSQRLLTAKILITEHLALSARYAGRQTRGS